MTIVNPIEILRTSVDSVNKAYAEALENPCLDSFYNLKRTALKASREINTLTPEERSITREIASSEYRDGFFSGSYIARLMELIPQIEEKRGKSEDESFEDYFGRMLHIEGFRELRERIIESLDSCGIKVKDGLASDLEE